MQTVSYNRMGNQQHANKYAKRVVCVVLKNLVEQLVWAVVHVRMNIVGRMNHVKLSMVALRESRICERDDN